MKAVEKETTVQPAVWENKKVGGQISELKAEFKRIEWTSKQELILYTKIVLISIFVFGMLVYVVDLAIQGVLWGIQDLVRLIAG